MDRRRPNAHAPGEAQCKGAAQQNNCYTEQPIAQVHRLEQAQPAADGRRQGLLRTLSLLRVRGSCARVCKLNMPPGMRLTRDVLQ